MTYHTEYELLIDLPTGEKAGTVYRKYTDSDCKMRFFRAVGHSFDSKGLSFSLSEVQNERFFKPLGEPQPFILPFPESVRVLEEFYNLIPTRKFVPNVEQIRLIDPVVNSEEFEQRLYELIKQMYNEKYK